MGSFMPTVFAAPQFWRASATAAAVPLGQHLWIGGLAEQAADHVYRQAGDQAPVNRVLRLDAEPEHGHQGRHRSDGHRPNRPDVGAAPPDQPARIGTSRPPTRMSYATVHALTTSCSTHAITNIRMLNPAT
jgi:hypothetical protein